MLNYQRVLEIYRRREDMSCCLKNCFCSSCVKVLKFKQIPTNADYFMSTSNMVYHGSPPKSSSQCSLSSRSSVSEPIACTSGGPRSQQLQLPLYSLDSAHPRHCLDFGIEVVRMSINGLLGTSRTDHPETACCSAFCDSSGSNYSIRSNSFPSGHPRTRATCPV